MSCTNDDLKRLNEEKQNHDKLCAPDCMWKEFKLEALLTRLEAAERRILQIEKDSGEELCECTRCFESEELWHQAAGSNEK